MPSIFFLIQSNKNPSPIYVRFTDTSFDTKAKTDLLIEPSKWSKVKKQPKNLRDAESKFIWSRLTDIESQIFASFNRLNKESEYTINAEWLYAILRQKESKESPIPSSITKYFDFYYNEKREDGAKINYLKKVRSIQNLVTRFLKSKRGINNIEDVDLNWADGFVKFMRKEGYKQSYIFRCVKFVKSVCVHARNKGVPTSVSLPSIKTKDQKAIKTYLSFQEIDMIKKAEMPTESLENARDWLVISCYLGQRVSDLMKCHSNLIHEVKGGKLLDLVQEKTELPIRIAIFPEVEECLKKRNGEFPRPISHQKYNDFIKEVSRLAGLTYEERGSLHNKELNRDIEGMYPKWQLITSHVGRRSFATNYYNDYPISLLMAQTGHKSEKSLREYLGRGRSDQVLILLEMVKN